MAGSIILALAGIVWIAYGAVVMGTPRYYDPVSLLDYVAVASYSLALATTSVGLALTARSGGLRTLRAARSLLTLSAIGGLVAAGANLGEDRVRIAALGAAYVGGVMVFYLCLVAAGLVLVSRARELRWIGALLVVPFPAPLIGPAAGYAVTGLSFVAAGALLGRLTVERPAMPEPSAST